jgi:hypothetical protein
MALATVQDILSAWPGWVHMDLSYGDQMSGQGSGETIVKRLRDPLWTLHAESGYLKPNALRKWKAIMDGLDNGRRLFLGYESASVFPAKYPRGTWPTGVAFDGISAKVRAIGGDGVSLQLKNLPAAFAGSIGDMIQITDADGDPAPLCLVRLLETYVADGGGLTAAFQVSGTIPAWVAVDDTVAVTKAACHMMIVPGSLNCPKDISGGGTISFDGLQVPTP